MRPSKLSGIYYHATNIILEKQIKECFTGPKGPGDLHVKPESKKQKPMAIIAPVHQYDVCGQCAAWAYKDLAEYHIPEVYIIIGQSKQGVSGITMEPYETPFGIARTDQALARVLLEKKSITENNALFDNDDSIESQIPFLQFVHPGKSEGIKILPMLLGSDVKLKKLAVDIKEALMESDKTAAIIIPTNFTSYGKEHGYYPFEPREAYKSVYDLDKEAISFLEKNDVNGFLKFVEDKGMNTDNILGIVLAMLIVKPKKVVLEQYYTTADLNKDYKNFVSFAAVAMYP